ncbi:hypothetical protein [Streptomyces sp. NPDC089919]|uniref:hypothetical protein n=1 Tax=Streptomyces sp. NPDC089919 TaxID=3155188 RepID=UPI00341D7CF4
MSGQQTTTTAFPVLDDLEDVWAAADALAQGRAVAHGFGAGYALTSRPDRDAVERVEGLTGGPAVRSGGVTTVPERVAALFDWSLLPREFPRRPLLDLVRDLLALGPFGFRGPAAAQLPAHLTAVRDGVRTVRLVAPGLGCPSRAFLGAALDRTGTGFLALVPADRPGRRASP